jgi:hypothetical protein
MYFLSLFEHTGAGTVMWTKRMNSKHEKCYVYRVVRNEEEERSSN